jgi:preprotein translocase SecE subunit
MAQHAEKTVPKVSQIDRLVQFLKEVRNEFTKVTWPGSTEVKGATVVVCIFVAFVIWVVDKIINLGVDAIF